MKKKLIAILGISILSSSAFAIKLPAGYNPGDKDDRTATNAGTSQQPAGSGNAAANNGGQPVKK